MRTQINYKGFYITICQSKKNQKLIGTLYSKIYNSDIYYYIYRHYADTVEQLIDKMKKEVDVFLIREKEYLERQIKQTKCSLDYLNTKLLDIEKLNENAIK